MDQTTTGSLQLQRSDNYKKSDNTRDHTIKMIRHKKDQITKRIRQLRKSDNYKDQTTIWIRTLRTRQLKDQTAHVP
jgi:hypothetical protein